MYHVVQMVVEGILGVDVVTPANLMHRVYTNAGRAAFEHSTRMQGIRSIRHNHGTSETSYHTGYPFNPFASFFKPNISCLECLGGSREPNRWGGFPE